MAAYNIPASGGQARTINLKKGSYPAFLSPVLSGLFLWKWGRTLFVLASAGLFAMSCSERAISTLVAIVRASSSDHQTNKV